MQIELIDVTPDHKHVLAALLELYQYDFTEFTAEDTDLLILSIRGPQALGWEGEGYSATELTAVRGWLGSKAFTIYGGSQEVQSNIIAKRILGLPDPLGKSSH